MKFNIKILIFLAVGISHSYVGCKSNCKVYCNNTISFQALGFTLNELDSIVVNVYAPNDSFNNLISSELILIYDSSARIQSTWIRFTPSSQDTFLNSNPKYSISPPIDVEILVPYNHKRYRYSKITYDGTPTQNQECHEGVASPGTCFQHITSYSLNGSTIHFNQPDQLNSLFFNK